MGVTLLLSLGTGLTVGQVGNQLIFMRNGIEIFRKVIEGGSVPVVKTQKNVEMPLLPEGSQWERNVLNSFTGGKSTPVTYGGGTTLYRVG